MRCLQVVLGAALGSAPCLDREIQLHMHVDLGPTFKPFRENMHTAFRDMLLGLTSKYSSFRWGMTGFGDRSDHEKATSEACYVDDTAPLMVLPWSVEVMMKSMDSLIAREQSGLDDSGRDPFGAIPHIISHHYPVLSDSRTEVRLLLIITDSRCKWSPESDNSPGSGTRDIPDDNLDTPICDRDYKYVNQSQLMTKIREAYIQPTAFVYNHHGSLASWKKFFRTAGFTKPPLQEIKHKADVAAVIDQIKTLVQEYSCGDPAGENATHPTADASVKPQHETSESVLQLRNTTSVPLATTSAATTTDAPRAEEASHQSTLDERSPETLFSTSDASHTPKHDTTFSEVRYSTISRRADDKNMLAITLVASSASVVAAATAMGLIYYRRTHGQAEERQYTSLCSQEQSGGRPEINY